MGLHIHSISKIPMDLEKEYYLYLLEFGPRDPFSEALRACFDEISDWASRSNSVVVRGTDRVHFEDEVFSYHEVNGLDGNEILPAILISTINPHAFNEQHKFGRYRDDDKLIIIPLRKFVDNSDQVYGFVRKLLAELKAGKNLSDIEVIKPRSRSIGKRLLDSIVLQPNFIGIGVDLKSLFITKTRQQVRDATSRRS